MAAACSAKASCSTPRGTSSSCPTIVGHGQSSKPSDGLRMKFPKYGYTDMVTLQHQLVTEGAWAHAPESRHGHVDGRHAHVDVGPHVSGLLHPAWFPWRATRSRLPGATVSGARLLVDAIVTDPTWNNGNYTEPPRGMASAVGFLLMATSVPLQWQKQFPTAAEADKLLADQHRGIA